MSGINGIGGGGQVQRVINNPVQKTLPTEAAGKTAVADRLELSGMSHLMKALKQNDVRVDKVADIRAQIEAGKYETDEKLDLATDRLLDELLK